MVCASVETVAVAEACVGACAEAVEEAAGAVVLGSFDFVASDLDEVVVFALLLDEQLVVVV